jgi:two-component system NarL family sensor kinase
MNNAGASSTRWRKITSRVVNAAENERRRVSRELHDSVNQLLATVGHGLRSAQSRLSPGQPAANDVRRSLAMLTEAIEEVRRIARNLRPPLLDDLGLLPALRLLAQEFTENSRIKTSLDLPFEEPALSVEAKLALYRIAQEAFSNVDRHSEATRVRLKCAVRPGRLSLTIEDDGKGFDPAAAVSPDSSGLANLRERAALISGTFNVRSARGKGTLIEVSLPLNGKPRNGSRR